MSNDAVFDAEEAGQETRPDLGREAVDADEILQRAASGDERGGFGVHLQRRRSLDLPPVIENLGDVADVLAAAGDSQGQVIVLSAGVLRTKAAHLQE